MGRAAGVAAAMMVLVLAAAPLPAGDIDLQPGLTEAQFERFVGVMGESIAMPTGPWKGMGVPGFEVVLVGAWVEADSNTPWWRNTMPGTGDEMGGKTSYALLGRVGLPWGIDLGGQVGEVAGETFWSAEIRKELVNGEGLKPAVGLRGTYASLGGPADVSVYGLDLGISKRFLLFEPFGSVGYRWAEGRASWGDPVSTEHSVDAGDVVFSAGVDLALPLLRFRLEARQGAETAVFFGVGLRL